jgi:hypothetical protein
MNNLDQQASAVPTNGGAATVATLDTSAAAPSKPLTSPARRHKSQVVFFSYPKFLYVWPLIFVTALFPLLGDLISPQTQGWVIVITLLTVLMAMGFDLSRNLTISWAVTIIASVFCILWLKDAKNVLFFDHIGHFLSVRNPVVSRDWQFLFAVFGGTLYLIMCINAHVNQRWRIGHNEIEHIAMLSKDDSLGRGAKRIITSYPDFLELLLCGAGTIQIYSAQGGILLRSIPNVPWLFFRSTAISRILEATEVSAASDEEDTDQQEASGTIGETAGRHGG